MTTGYDAGALKKAFEAARAIPVGPDLEKKPVNAGVLRFPAKNKQVPEI